MGQADVVETAVERLVISATRLWRVVVGAEAASPAGRASVAIVAPGLARSFDELAESIEVVLLDGQESEAGSARARGGGGR